MEFLYREAEASDAAALIEYNSTVGSETDNLSFDGETFRISEEREAKFIDRFHRSDRDIMLVALCGDKIVANAILECERTKRYNHRAELSITVLKEFWGKGIGSTLMSMLIDFAREKKIKSIYLEVRGDNLRAISLYRKFGFEKIGEYKDFFKIKNEYFDADFMVLQL